MLLLYVASLVSEAEQVIASHSANPSAVQFEDVHQGDGIVCGMVNRPNRLGGYDGFEMFLYMTPTRWSIGSAGGLVMADGQLTDLDYLNARTASVGYRRGTEIDVDNLELANAAQGVRSAMLRACPKQLDTN